MRRSRPAAFRSAPAGCQKLQNAQEIPLRDLYLLGAFDHRFGLAQGRAGDELRQIRVHKRGRAHQRRLLLRRDPQVHPLIRFNRCPRHNNVLHSTVPM